MIYLILCHTIIHLIIRLIVISKRNFRFCFNIFYSVFQKCHKKKNIEIFRFFFRNVLFQKLLSSFLSFLHVAWIQALADAKKCSEVLGGAGWMETRVESIETRWWFDELVLEGIEKNIGSPCNEWFVENFVIKAHNFCIFLLYKLHFIAIETDRQVR